MKVRLTRNYTPPPEWGQFAYGAGMILTGQLAQWALQAGAGIVVGPEVETKVIAPKEMKRRGRPRKTEAA